MRHVRDRWREEFEIVARIGRKLLSVPNYAEAAIAHSLARGQRSSTFTARDCPAMLPIEGLRLVRRGRPEVRMDPGKSERAMGIEPTTYSLGSCRSTTELRPQNQRPIRFSKETSHRPFSIPWKAHRQLVQTMRLLARSAADTQPTS
jgi:hypothetical protein